MTAPIPDEATTRESPASSIRTWGPLEVREPLGDGSFGTVYRAWDPRLAKEVALKVLHRQRAGQASERLLAEAKRLARIRHPHVVTVFGAEVFEGSIGFWMELIRGITLEQYLRRQGTMGPDEAASLGAAIAQALAAVHAAGLVHGDVKARNIMRETGGRYVLTDFGASSDLATLSGRTRSSVVGTPLYMAPEILRGGTPTPGSDIYSLSVLLFHCVTNDYPVVGASMEAVRLAHDRGEKKHLRDVRPDLSAAFVQVVERALTDDPANRFATAGAMEHALVTLTGARPRVDRRSFVGALMAGGIATLAAGAAALFMSSSGTGRATVRTVAVLPFDSDGAPGAESFSRGLTDLLTARLCELSSLRVISQTSARQVRAQALVLPEAARRLGADAIVEGSIQTETGRIRVVVRLVHAASDSVIWTDSFEDTDGDVFRLQSNLALAVGRQLRQALSSKEEQRLASVDTTSSEAQAAFLRGWAALEGQTADGTKEAVRQFELAIRLDPNYARAHAVLSHAFWYLGAGVNAIPRSESAARAEAAARRALAIDPLLPRAHAALGQVHFYFEWNWPAAQAEFESAIRLNPSDADAHQQHGWFLAAIGKLDSALAHMIRARELDPLSYTRRSPVAAVLFYAKRYAEAVKELEQTLALQPTYRTAHFGMARAYSALGRTGDALRELDASRTDSPSYLAEVGRVHAQAGDRVRASAVLTTLRARHDAEPGSVPLDALAILHAALGDIAEALTTLEQAYKERVPGLLSIKVDPRYESLRTQPRFIRVIEMMRLTS